MNGNLAAVVDGHPRAFLPPMLKRKQAVVNIVCHIFTRIRRKHAEYTTFVMKVIVLIKVTYIQIFCLFYELMNHLKMCRRLFARDAASFQAFLQVCVFRDHRIVQFRLIGLHFVPQRRIFNGEYLHGKHRRVFCAVHRNRGHRHTAGHLNDG